MTLFNIERTEESKIVETLKAANLSCSKCPNYKKIQTALGKCSLKQNKIVKAQNICNLYGKVLIS